MSPNNADAYIPAEIAVSPELPQLWGRLLSLSPAGARLLSRFELRGARSISLSFGVGRASFTGLLAAITAAARDADGWHEYELSFPEPSQRELVRAALGGSIPASVEATPE